jgi:hypothetical protein
MVMVIDGQFVLSPVKTWWAYLADYRSDFLAGLKEKAGRLTRPLCQRLVLPCSLREMFRQVNLSGTWSFNHLVDNLIKQFLGTISRQFASYMQIEKSERRPVNWRVLVGNPNPLIKRFNHESNTIRPALNRLLNLKEVTGKRLRPTRFVAAIRIDQQYPSQLIYDLTLKLLGRWVDSYQPTTRGCLINNLLAFSLHIPSRSNQAGKPKRSSLPYDDNHHSY